MRLLIVDDHDVVRRGVRSFLHGESRYDICGEAVDGQDAIDKARELKPDVIVMDISMPNLNGLEAARQIRNILPQCEVLILSQHNSAEMARQALKAGARGYVVKSSISRDLVAALQKVSQREFFFDPAILGTAPNSSRELDVQEVLKRSAAFEQALREGELLYRTTFELAGIGVAHVSPEGRWLRVNKKLCDIVGYSEEELLKLTFQEITHPDDLAADLALTAKVVSGELPSFSMEKRYIRKDKSIVWVNLNVSTARDINGKMKHFISLVEDITERRHAQEVLHESQTQLELALESSRTAIFDWDPTMQRGAWNPQLSAMYKFTPRSQYITAAEWRSLFHPEDVPRLAQEFEAFISDPAISQFDFELRTVRPNGEVRWILSHGRVVRDSSNRALRLIGTHTDITERKNAERSTNLLAAIVDSSDDAIISKNLNGIITSWNKSAQRLFGYTAAEAIGQSITLIIPPERRQEETEIISRLRRGESIDHFETVRVRKDGGTLELSLTISPIRDVAGRVVGASKVARDITEQKRAQRAVRESEERLRTILETTPDCVKLVAPDGTVLHMNTPGLRMVGAKSSAEVVGNSVYDLVAPEDREKFRALNQRVCNGEKGSLQFDSVGLDGTRRHMETHAAPMRNPDGNLILLAITRDVTARKRAEATLREQQERFDMVKEASQVGFWFCDLPLDKLQWDKRVKEHFWLPAEAEVTIDTFYQRLHPDDRERTRQTIADSIANDLPYDIEYRTISPDGRHKWIRAMGRTFYDADHQPKSFDGLTFDITDRKEAEENYRRLTETLEAEVHARTQELEGRNAEVLMHSEQVRDLSARLIKLQDEERRHFARELHDSAGQTLTALSMNLSALINEAKDATPSLTKKGENILELVQQLSREIRTTSYLLHPPLLDESGLASALNWYVQGVTERSGLAIDLKISDNLGRLPADLELAIFRLVQECLTNIHRHSGSKTAAIRLAREGENIAVEVRDQGRGISKKRLAEIQSQGSGVGIRGMRERLRQFRGELNIQSNGSGTTILVNIPVPKESPSTDGETLEAVV